MAKKLPGSKSVGRPSKMTDEVIRKIEEVAALDGSVEEMAYYAGVHPDTIYAWLKENKVFSDRIKALRERPILKARQTIVKSLENAVTAQWYLERKKKREFAQRQEITGADGEKLFDEETTKKSKSVVRQFLGTGKAPRKGE